MRLAFGQTLFGIGLGLLVVPSAMAQPGGGSRVPAAANLVERMMAFDGDKDGQLTKSEVTDARSKRLFDQADADKDGIVTRSELNALMVRERASARGNAAPAGGAGAMRRRFGAGQGNFGGGAGNGPRGFGGGPGGRPGGFAGGPGGLGGGGFGGPGGPPRPGQILPPMLRQRLSLTPEQQTQVDALQKDVDAKLAQILTAEQKQQLREMGERGPGRPGFGGPGGFRGPAGGPPPGNGPGGNPPPP